MAPARTRSEWSTASNASKAGSMLTGLTAEETRELFAGIQALRPLGVAVPGLPGNEKPSNEIPAPAERGEAQAESGGDTEGGNLPAASVGTTENSEAAAASGTVETLREKVRTPEADHLAAAFPAIYGKLYNDRLPSPLTRLRALAGNMLDERPVIVVCVEEPKPQLRVFWGLEHVAPSLSSQLCWTEGSSHSLTTSPTSGCRSRVEQRATGSSLRRSVSLRQRRWMRQSKHLLPAPRFLERTSSARAERKLR
mmetsp:Transcript_43809/g.133329  ORF Transcript_43809/g.133329 Transcript_43809/m.133329 type:complete len:253 (-) Transcript_43809:1475-2233(-)